jgi:hypothetical protein
MFKYNSPREFHKDSSSAVGAAFAIAIAMAVVAIWILC